MFSDSFFRISCFVNSKHRNFRLKDRRAGMAYSDASTGDPSVAIRVRMRTSSLY
jgi:hypothetical protein